MQARCGCGRALAQRAFALLTAAIRAMCTLSSPGAHKTSATFGPSTTTVPAAIARCLATHLGLSAVPEGGYVFARARDPFAPMEPNQWTTAVKAVFKRWGGVALAPKDLRSSFVTFLKTGEHSNETLRAAAIAMRHSSKTQGSAAYHKGQSDLLVQAAVDAAAEFAATFPAVAKPPVQTSSSETQAPPRLTNVALYTL